MTLGGIRGLVEVCYKSSATHTKDFGEKNSPKSPDFNFFLSFSSEINIFRQ
jgi:hypothetical protein